MKHQETLHWILDKLEKSKVGIIAHDMSDERIREKVDFVHSLGLKCDCVGWCSLDLSHSGTQGVFDAIAAFCEEKGLNARGYYEKKYVDVESDWFELVPTEIKDNTYGDRIYTETEEGEQIFVSSIRAYHELIIAPKSCSREEIFFPERFRDFLVKYYPEAFDFCWVKDLGKYEAAQYFSVYGNNLVPRVAVSYDIDKRFETDANDRTLIDAAGGWLPQLADLFYRLRISMEHCYLKSDLPEGGIAYARVPWTYSRVGFYTILFHRDVVEVLLEQKIIPEKCLRPVPVVNELPGGYNLINTEPIERPARRFMDEMLSGYEKIKQASCPVRSISEKDALRVLRQGKRERKEDFSKALAKTKALELAETAYSPLIPYYTVAYGGFLSDEYEFLSHEQALIYNEEFQADLAKEELVEDKPEGIVFAKCPDGDCILLCSNGEVIRFSHECPEILEQWPCLAQFFVDAYNE